jgi:hypothetical protein
VATLAGLVIVIGVKCLRVPASRYTFAQPASPELSGATLIRSIIYLMHSTAAPALIAVVCLPVLSARL